MTKDELGNLILAGQNKMWRIACSILSNRTDCEDAVGNTILKAFEKIDMLRNDKYANTWLIRILINECYEIGRKNSRRALREEVLDENLADFEQDWQEQLLDKTDLYQALFSLPEEQRITVVLHYIEDIPIKEVAGILEIPVGTVKSRLSQAKKSLKNALKEGR